MTEQQNKMFKPVSQREAAFVPLSQTDGQACANCRFFYGDGGCVLVENVPEPIYSTSWCNRWEVAPVEDTGIEDTVTLEDTQEMEAVTEVETEQRSLKRAVLDTLSSILDSIPGKGEKQQQTDFIVQGNHWFARFSNAFKDREDEYFPTKAIDDYIARVDSGLVEPPEVWVWHVPGSRYAKAHGVGRIGRILTAWGEFDDTPKGRAAKGYYSKHKEAMSHGFMFNPAEKAAGQYWDFNTFEITTLPRKVAANPFTTFEEIKAMKLTPEKIEHLKKVFGDDIAGEIIADTEKASKALEEAGVGYKEFSTFETPAETAATKDAAQAADENTRFLTVELVKDLGEVALGQAAAVKEIKALALRLDELAAENKALRTELSLSPRASQSSSTAVDPESAFGQALKGMFDSKQAGEKDPIYGLPKEQN